MNYLIYKGDNDEKFIYDIKCNNIICENIEVSNNIQNYFQVASVPVINNATSATVANTTITAQRFGRACVLNFSGFDSINMGTGAILSISLNFNVAPYNKFKPLFAGNKFPILKKRNSEDTYKYDAYLSYNESTGLFNIVNVTNSGNFPGDQNVELPGTHISYITSD